MPYAIDTSNGVFVGISMGLIFQSGFETAGQTTVAVFETVADANDIITYLGAHLGDENLRAVKVASGHWRDLQKAGLEVYDMPQNELLYIQKEGSVRP